MLFHLDQYIQICILPFNNYVVFLCRLTFVYYSILSTQQSINFCGMNEEYTGTYICELFNPSPVSGYLVCSDLYFLKWCHSDHSCIYVFEHLWMYSYSLEPQKWNCLVKGDLNWIVGCPIFISICTRLMVFWCSFPCSPAYNIIYYQSLIFPYLKINVEIFIKIILGHCLKIGSIKSYNEKQRQTFLVTVPIFNISKHVILLLLIYPL